MIIFFSLLLLYCIFCCCCYVVYGIPSSTAVIGGGIGGAAVSYFLSKDIAQDNNSNYSHGSTIIFERNAYIGGRLKHTIIGGRTVELGGDEWSSLVNEYVVDIVKELNITTNNMVCRGTATAVGNNVVGTWNGKTFVADSSIIRKHLLSDAVLASELAKFAVQLRYNYARRGEAMSFSSVNEFLQLGSLSTYTNISTNDFFTRHGVSSTLLQSVIVPMLHDIYGQDGTAHSFAAIVALLAATRSDSVLGGNSKLVEAMLHASNADVRLSSRVVAIERIKRGGYNVTYHYAERVHSVHVNTVVLASPIEFMDITFTPPSLLPKKLIKRPFVHCFVHIVIADAINPRFFGLVDNVIIPDTLFTTMNETIPFTSIMAIDVPTHRNNSIIYKMFATRNLTSLLPRLFMGYRDGDVLVQRWPYTFPRLKPNAEFQPIRFAKGLYYVNSMESVASAMEGSLIAGRNIALLLKETD